MSDFILTFDLDSTQSPDYERVNEVLYRAGFRTSILSKAGKMHHLPFNTYCISSNGDSGVVYGLALRELNGLGYSVLRLIAAKYSEATFGGPLVLE